MEDFQIGSYELLVIIPAKFTEEEIQPILQNIKNLIQKENGTIILEESLGRRRFAYKVGEFFHGYYFLFRFELLKNTLKTIDHALHLNADVLRYQIIKTKKITKEEIEKEKTLQMKRQEELLKKETNAKDKTGEKTPTKILTPKIPVQEPLSTIPKKEEAGKLTLEELDKKLDEILDQGEKGL